MTSSRALAVFALVTSLAGAAFAGQPTAEDYATARALYKEGKELRAAGNLKGALEKLKAAHALGRTPITGIELARTEEQLGMLVEAREICLDVVRMPIASDESERSAAARKEAAELADALRKRLGAIRIRVSAPDAIVAVDGENVPAAALGEPRLVDPGHHVVTAHVEGGATVSASADVGESQTADVSLAPPAATAAQKIQPPPPPPEHPRSHGLGAVTISGIVVTGAGLAAGAIGGLVALFESNDLKPNCANQQCFGTYADELGVARGAATTSTIGFTVAGVGIVLLVVGLVTHGSSSESVRGLRVVPDFGLGSFGVHGAF